MDRTIITAVILLLTGCTDEFQPNGPYVPRLSVYAVLTVADSTQFVTVESSVDPSTHSVADPVFRGVPGAAVRLSSGTDTVRFRDTLLAGDAGVPRHFISTTAPVGTNKTYTVSVDAPGHPPASATVRTFTVGAVYASNVKILADAGEEEGLTVQLLPGRGSFANLLRVIFEYEWVKNGVWTSATAELPVGYDGDRAVFPSFGFNTTSTSTVVYKPDAYRRTVRDLRARYADSLRFIAAVFEFTQYDQHLFTYYSVANKFPGGSTVRLDDPDHTNVNDGYGVVGVTSRTVYRTAMKPLP